MKIAIDHTGEKFGLWTVKSKTVKGKVFAECECGTIKEVYIQNLITGKSRSCECLRNEIAKKRLSTHGESKTKLYYVWLSMKNRCYNEKVNGYHRYGGRGIKVCDEWIKSFDPFKTWAKDNGYNDGLEIDRIDNDGNYNHDNCRWVTKKQNLNNMSKNHILSINGVEKTISEWSDHSGIKRQTIQSRLKYGWDNKDLLLPATLGSNQYSNLK